MDKSLIPGQTGGFGLGFVHFQAAPVHARTVKRLDSASRIGRGHFHKAKTPGAARFTVRHQIDGIDSTVCGKKITNLIFRRRPGQIAHINRLAHKNPREKKVLHMVLASTCKQFRTIIYEKYTFFVMCARDNYRKSYKSLYFNYNYLFLLAMLCNISIVSNLGQQTCTLPRAPGRASRPAKAKGETADRAGVRPSASARGGPLPLRKKQPRHAQGTPTGGSHTEWPFP